MGQKVNPHGLRVGVIQDWDSRWFANKAAFGDTLVEDYNVRNFIKKSLKDAGVPKVEIERYADKVRIHVYCAKPGIVIGRGGENIEKLRLSVEKMMGKSVYINIVEVKQPDLNATLVAENIATQLENRVSYRRAMKQAIGRSMKLGAKGIKVKVGGLQTIRADIDYGFAEAHTTYGRLGVKVWIYKGEILKGEASAARVNKAPAEKPERKRRNNDGKRREGGYRPRSNKNEGGNA